MRLRPNIPLLCFFLLLPGRTGSVSLEVEDRPRHAEVHALPQLALIRSGGRLNFRLRGHLSAKKTRWAKDTIQAITRDIQRRFLRRASDKASGRPEIVEVCLFARSSDYRRFVAQVFGAGRYEQDLGIYSPYHRILAADLARSPASLKHELVHPLLSAAGGFPLWLEEGLAELYADSRWKHGRLRFGRRHRLARLRAMLAADRMPGPARLHRADDRVLYGPRGLDYTTTARFLLLYLQENNPQALEGLVAELRGGADLSQALEKNAKWDDFRAWCKKITHQGNSGLTAE